MKFRNITYKDFFNKKENVGILVTNQGQLEAVQKKCIQYTCENRFEGFETYFDKKELASGIVLVNKGSWFFADEVCPRIQVFKFNEVGGLKDLDAASMDDEGFKRLMRAMFGIGYSFRFNEERRTTTLYKTKAEWVKTEKSPKVKVSIVEKLRVVKCHEEDTFDWKVGLALCFARSIFAKDTEVQYLKTKLSSKKFAEYVLMKVYKFNEDDYDQLKLRVKDAGACDEIYI